MDNYIFKPNFRIASTPQHYQFALDQMDQDLLEARKFETDTVWLLEHFDVYTAGSSAKAHDLLVGNKPELAKIPVVRTSRGGQFTYHGPGQRIVYLTICLSHLFGKKIPDVKKLVRAYEQIIINSLQQFNIKGERRESRIGIWVENGGKEAKIASIGLKITRKVTTHGFAINVNPDLSRFAGIVPCGIKDYGVTSIAHETGEIPDYEAVNSVLIREIRQLPDLIASS